MDVNLHSSEIYSGKVVCFCSSERSRESLQEYCLLEITENLDKYIAYYRASGGTALAKQFEFLQRAYSETILYRLKVKELEERHLDLLVNLYLKNLDIRHFDKRLIFLIGNKLKTSGNGVISIKARFSKLLSRHLIPSSSQLEVIEIGFRNTPASSIHGIHTIEMIRQLGRHCPALRILKLRNGENPYSSSQSPVFLDRPLSSELYKAVCSLLDNCPSLEVLENINTVEILYQKHVLDYENNDLEKQRKYSLTKLSFLDGIHYPLADAFKICYVLCPKVSCVQLFSIRSDDQLFKYTDFSLFDDVKIVTREITVDGMSQFLKVKGNKLVNIELHDACVSARAIVECCPTLKSLRLSNMYQYQPLTDKDFSFPVANLPGLKSFIVDRACFSQKKVADSFKLILSVATNLESVSFLSSTGLDEDFCTSILKLGLNRIHELNVVRTDITSRSLRNWLSQGNLRKLKVRYCNGVYHDGSFALRQCKGNDEDLEVRCKAHWFDNNFVYLLPKEWEFLDEMYFDTGYDSDLDYFDTDRDAYFDIIFGRNSMEI